MLTSVQAQLIADEKLHKKAVQARNKKATRLFEKEMLARQAVRFAENEARDAERADGAFGADAMVAGPAGEAG